MLTIKKLLSADLIQRLLYLAGIVIWTLFCWQEDLTNDKPTELFWAIPTLLALIQVVFNNKLVWKLLFITMTIYSGFVILLMISGLMSHHEATITLTCLMISFLLFSVCWIIYHLEPKLHQGKIR